MNRWIERVAARADQAEVYHLRRSVVPVQFDAQGLSVIKSQSTQGVALRVICQGRLGYATSTDTAHPEHVIDEAIATAAFGDVAGIEFPSEVPSPAAGLSNSAIENLTAEQLVDLGDGIRAAIARADSEVEIAVSVRTTVDRLRIANTAGLDVDQTTGGLSVEIEATRARQDDIFTVFDSLHVRALTDAGPELATARVLKLLELGRNVVPAPSGALPVVFTPSGALAVLLPLVIGLSGQSALLGMSPLRDKLGQRAFDPRFSLFDDGRCASGSRAGSFDDEGVPTRRTALVQDGVVDGFYYDLRTAAQAGAQSTGNGYKGGLIGGSNFRTAPSASVSHVIVSEGDASEDDIVRSIKRGLLVDSVLGLGQGNLHAGDFSNNVSSAFLIDEGRIVGRVKNAMISGNSYDLLLHHLIGLSECGRWTYGRFRSPSIALANVNVAAK